VAIANQNKGKGNQKKEWMPRKKAATEGDILDKPCIIHITKDDDGNLVYLNHTTRQRRALKRMMSGKLAVNAF
jgi:hypothetical protein